MRKFDLWPLDLVESNIHGLHSLQQKECQKSIKLWIFDDPFHIERPGEVILLPTWWQHHAQQVFWWNEAIEATEVIEAVEVIEAAEVPDGRKSTNN